MWNKCSEDMELEESGLNAISGGSIEESKKDCGLGLKRGELDLDQKLMAECADTLESREKKMREMSGDFSLLKKSMEDWCCKLELKRRDLEEWAAKLELKKKLVESKFEELDVIDKRVNDCLNDAQLKEQHFDSLVKSIQEDKQHLDSLKMSAEEREKHLGLLSHGLQRKEREFEMQQQQQFDAIYHMFQMKENELELQTQELELKRQQIESLCHLFQIKEGQLEKQAKDLESKHKQIDSLHQLIQMEKWQVENQTKELVFKQQQNDSISQLLKIKERALDQRAQELEFKQQQIDSFLLTLQMREKELEQQVKQLDLKQKQFDSQMKTAQLKHTPAAKNATISSSGSDESRPSINRGLQFFMNEHLKRIDSMRTQMSAAFRMSSDPGKLVLDAMQGFYPSNLNLGNRETDFDLRFIRRSCIIMLQELERMSPQINPCVREEALKLAADWKAKMTVATDNSLEVLGFLRLIIAFELTSAYDANELQGLLSVIVQPEQAAQLRRALGVKDKAPATNNISSLGKVEEPESTNAATFSFLNLQSNATMDARNVSGFRNEHLSENCILATSVPLSSDVAKLVLNSIQKYLAEYLGNGDLEESIMSSNISQLEELMRVSPHVGPHLKADAANLAVQWKAKMTGNTENSLEGLGFLLFIASYGLLSILNIHEIIKLLGLICQDKQALELCQTHGFADKITDFIQILIEKKHLVEAVRFIFAFKLMDKLPPVQLLKEFVEDAKKFPEAIWRLQISLDEKEKVADCLIGDLRAVHQYIKDYNLEFEYSSADIQTQIVNLEGVKANWRHSVPSLGSNVEQQEQRKRKKPSASTSARVPTTTTGLKENSYSLP